MTRKPFNSKLKVAVRRSVTLQEFFNVFGSSWQDVLTAASKLTGQFKPYYKIV
jgi:hypothetical protein